MKETIMKRLYTVASKDMTFWKENYGVSKKISDWEEKGTGKVEKIYREMKVW